MIDTTTLECHVQWTHLQLLLDSFRSHFSILKKVFTDSEEALLSDYSAFTVNLKN